MHALVTGGAGFIGSSVVARLQAEGHTVRVLDNFSTGRRENVTAGVDLIEGDIRDAAAVAKAVHGVDTIFHLAACIGNVKSQEVPIEDSSINVLGTVTLLEAARRAEVRTVVYSSSAAIFGDLVQETVNETHPQDPISPYGVSKLAAEKHVFCFGKLYGIRTVCLRYFNVYGVRQHYDSYGNVIPIFAHRLKKNEPLTIYGDGSQTRDFVNVRDVAEANLLAATRAERSAAYNVGTGTTVTISELAALLQDISGRASGVTHAAPRPGEVLHCRADTTLIARDLGYVPKTVFAEGLREYWSWFARSG